MKDITKKLIELFKDGYCTPQIAKIAKKIHEPSTTIHYNIKKMEKEGMIKSYKAVFNHKKIEEGHCVFVMIKLGPDNYGDPEKVAKEMAKDPRVESINICTGDYGLILKLRTKEIDEYYEFTKHMIKKYNLAKTESITSLKQIKSEFVE